MSGGGHGMACGGDGRHARVGVLTAFLRLLSHFQSGVIADDSESQRGHK